MEARKRIFSSAVSVAFVGVFLAYLIVDPSNARAAAFAGYELWLKNLLPSLFPFFVVTGFVGKSGAARKIAPAFSGAMGRVFATGGASALPYVSALFSGHTVGAKMTCDMYLDAAINRREATVLMALTSTASPIFVYSTVGCVFFGSTAVGTLLLAVSWISALASGFLVSLSGRPPKHAKPLPKPETSTASGSLMSAFSASVTDSVVSILNVGGFVVFFQVVLSLVTRPLAAWPWADAAARAIVETTSATQALGNLFAVNPDMAFVGACAALGFAGLSIVFQTLSFLTQTDLDAGAFIKAKLMQTAIATALGWGACRLLPKGVATFAQEHQTSSAAGLKNSALLLFVGFTGIIALTWIHENKRRYKRT